MKHWRVFHEEGDPWSGNPDWYVTCGDGPDDIIAACWSRGKAAYIASALNYAVEKAKETLEKDEIESR